MELIVRRIYSLILALVLTIEVTGLQVANAQQVYQTHKVVLLQPEYILSSRISGPSELAEYLKHIEEKLSRTLKILPPQPSAGFLVIAIRPNHQTYAWFDFEPKLESSVTTVMRQSVSSVQAPVVSDMILFAVNISLWGAPAST